MFDLFFHDWDEINHEITVRIEAKSKAEAMAEVKKLEQEHNWTSTGIVEVEE